MTITCIGSDENGHTYHFGTPPTDWKLPKGYMIKMDCYPGKFAEVVSNLKTEPWTGEGRPPVGVICEMSLFASNEWELCTPVHYLEQPIDHSDQVVVYQDSLGGEVCYVLDPPCSGSIEFRPVRTPEQIAADERAGAIDKLVEFFVNYYGNPKGSEQYLLICRSLHDAGYRKQVNP